MYHFIGTLIQQTGCPTRVQVAGKSAGWARGLVWITREEGREPEEKSATLSARHSLGLILLHAAQRGVRPAPEPNRQSMMRPSLIRGTSGPPPPSPDVFSKSKIADANVTIFTNDVLMEGELDKKGEGGLQIKKSRMFVLRGQELMYYTIEQSARYNYGAHKGTMDVRGATVERLEGLQFALTLRNANAPRVLTAPNVQALMDWMTAINIASTAITVEPPVDRTLVDHSRTTHIILVRHGQYHISQNSTQDVHGPLTELGIAQSKSTGVFLNEYLTQRQIFKRFPKFPIYHSGMKRSVETAQWMAQSFPKGGYEMHENKLFREAWPGNPLPSTNRKILAREKLDNMVSDCSRLRILWRTWFRHLIPEDLDVKECDLSEQEKADFAQIFGTKTQHRTGDRYRVVVCHANVIRWFVCRALGVDPEGTWGRMRYSNCGITELEIDSVGNVQISFLNQTGHLTTQQITEN